MSIAKVISSLPTMAQNQRDTIRGRAQAWLQTGSVEQQEQGRSVLEALDALERTETEALIQHVRDLPKAQRVAETFQRPAMTTTERAVVQVLLDHPGSTSSALSAALGWGAQSWHLHFGTMCFERRARLWPAPPAEKRDADFYSGILADFDPATASFTMNPDAAAGFAALGMVPRRPSG